MPDDRAPRAAVEAASRAFAMDGDVTDVVDQPGGHIHASYRVQIAGTANPYLLQQFNTRVFPQPDLVQANIARVSEHLCNSMRSAADRARRVLTPVPARSGEWLWRDAAGGCWRMFHFIADTRTHLRATTPAQAESAARAFGAFQRALADLPPPRLHETISGFHDTAARLAALEHAAEADVAGRGATVRAELNFIRAHRAGAAQLAELVRCGAVPERVVHNDAKIANVLFDATRDEALCVVDLDTVMPGVALHDFGDLVRSTATTAEEDDPDARRMTLDPQLYAALARGYLAEAAGFLNAAERAHLVAAARLITLEQAARFLTDYLDGDVYYRVARPRHNLERCRTQCALLASMAEHESEMQAVVQAALR